MKNATLALLCCSAFLIACDSSNDTDNKGEVGLYDKASSLTSDATDAAKDVSEGMASDLDSALASASDAADDAADRVKASTAAAADTAKESVDGVIDADKEMAAATGEKSASVIAAVSPAADSVVDSAKLNEGESVYKNNCNACHGTGVAGSPKLGDKAAWSARIAKGNAVLTEHALKGFQGEKGYMPAKGGFMNLSDEQVSAAVLYMVSKAQ